MWQLLVLIFLLGFIAPYVWTAATLEEYLGVTGDEFVVEKLEDGYSLPADKLWKEVRFTNEWLYSVKYPVLTAEVRWYCPFYAENLKQKKKRNKNECVNTVQLKYWGENHVDVLLDTFRVTYVKPNSRNNGDCNKLLKLILPQDIKENKIKINVALHHKSTEKTCLQLSYEIGEHGKVGKTKDTPDCTKLLLGEPEEWVVEKEDDEEEERHQESGQGDEAHTDLPHNLSSHA